ncbi:aminopeptidase PaaP [Marinobacter nanhaiticus D15-8W]|uniref:Aminopeptidase n=1 Tax=Marinobacter nanhaiticus D15-8W TaxID=626887 RepID=N6W1T5_9GAMM|nr:M28 family metallopeptidase [Marinobacter nanhaiticus]ENO14069.1 aminopeptidase [Marinobacter nanhaiticus D15-8W]BES71450.1 aminopeptidase PaaP [Marinobacter nanhaiticus D15-8W]
MRTAITKTALGLGSLVFALSAQANSDKSTSELLNEFWSPDRVGFFECRIGILNSTPFGLPRCMQAENIGYHLEMFYSIAEANDGNRAAGLPGYDASVDYVQSTLESAGYDVTIQPFPFTAFYPVAEGMLAATEPAAESYVWEEDFQYLSQTEPGDVTAPVVPVDLDLGPDNMSTSGCEAEDFAGFPAGSIALVQRGACNFGVKAENAAAAGAVGVIIFNQGNTEDRTGLLDATLGEAYSGGVPVFFATYDNGVAWSQREGLVLNMVSNVVREQTQTYNVLAETRKGDPDNVVMVGAHLDSVFSGAGINDNGSGSAAILELALQMKRAHPKNQVRFAWWGAEEAGLVGSTYYVNNLSEEEKAKIKVYLNYDMVASPNFAYFIYDGDGSDFGLEGPPGSAATERLFEKYFELRDIPSEGTEISFRSDYAQFFTDGIAFGGLFTGAEVLKTPEQAEKYGGEAGVAFDPCYHAECDDITNYDAEALEINADAMAFVTSWLSLSTRVIDEEIEAAEEEPETGTMMLNAQSVQQYDITHWGKHWIK